MKSNHGQATTEYLALVLLVMIVLAGATAITTGGIGDSIAVALRRGICEAAAEQCPASLNADSARDLEPCTLAKRNGSEALKVDIGVVRLAAELGLLVENLADGRVRVSFADSSKIGVGAAAGAHIAIGSLGTNSEVGADAGLVVNAGRAWLLPSAAAAERFIAKYGSSQHLESGLREGLRRACPLCGVLLDSPSRPPEADERWLSGGLAAGANAHLAGGPFKAGVEASLAAAAGQRQTRSGTTWFMRLDDRIAGSVDALGAGIDGQARVTAVVALELDRSGNPRAVRITSERRISTRRGLRVPAALRRILGATAVGNGELIESESLLQLASDADRSAAMELIASANHFDPVGGARALAAVRDALDARGIRTLRRWKMTRSGARGGAGAGVGARLGLDVNFEDSRQRLVGVVSRLPGLGWLQRADCLAA